jgi:hypothetical protein
LSYEGSFHCRERKKLAGARVDEIDGFYLKALHYYYRMRRWNYCGRAASCIFFENAALFANSASVVTFPAPVGVIHCSLCFL